MEQNLCCAIVGQPPMRFPWGFDEEDTGCQDLKLALAQKIMELRQRGVMRFAVVADCGVGLYAGECVNALRQMDAELMLFILKTVNFQIAVRRALKMNVDTLFRRHGDNSR